MYTQYFFYPSDNRLDCGLSHRPTLIAKSMVFWRDSALFHEKCPSTTVVVLFIAHRANHLRHGRLRCWQKLAWLYCTATELLALCYCLCWFWLVGWPKPI